MGLVWVQSTSGEELGDLAGWTLHPCGRNEEDNAESMAHVQR